MMDTIFTMRSEPKISVVIHFLNSATYLSQAVNSVLQQSFTDWEMVLVDGGSTDGSSEIAKEFEKKIPEKVRLLVHEGPEPLGIFSSRIWGAQQAKATVLALLDSDDEWHPQFLERHYAIYQSAFNNNPGMIFCPSTYWWEDPALAHRSYVQRIPEPGLHMPPKLVLEFVKESYAKTPCNSSVMIAREIIQDAAYLIGTAVEKMGDDQFLWSHVALNYPIYVSPEPLTRYRQWENSTCAQGFATGEYSNLRSVHLAWLLSHLLTAYNGKDKETLVKVVRSNLDREEKSTNLPAKKGLSNWKTHCNDILLNAWRDNGQYLLKWIRRIWTVLVNFFPSQIVSFFKLVKARVRLTTGIHPLSQYWGSDRGLPTHRYYLEQFLQEYRFDIRGNCLEFQDDSYTTSFGGSAVRKLDILHIDDTNPIATIVGDLTKPNRISSNHFDCIICTHVLHVIFELEKAISEIYRILKPGGILLVAVPHISMCDPNWHEVWRFTPEGLKLILAKAFGAENVTIKSYGNSLIAAGQIRGVVSHEFTKGELDYHDPRFAIEVCARAVKSPNEAKLNN